MSTFLEEVRNKTNKKQDEELKKQKLKHNKELRKLPKTIKNIENKIAKEAKKGNNYYWYYTDKFVEEIVEDFKQKGFKIEVIENISKYSYSIRYSVLKTGICIYW